jgi:hypothetical protein
MVCTLCWYPLLRTPTLIIETRLLWYLFTFTFHILAGFRNQESESSFHPASWVDFEFRKNRIWLEFRECALDLEQYATNHVAGQWIRFLPHILSRDRLVYPPALFHPLPPNGSFLFRYYGYGCTMKRPILAHSTDWISGTADSAAPI